MKKVFHFESPRGQYRCDAAIVWCFDDRFDLVLRKFLKCAGIERCDVVKIAGGAKSLVSPELGSDREFVLEQIRKSIRLHDTTRVILMVHSDCGAYGGLAAFGEDAAAEIIHHELELQAAADNLRREIPGIEINACFVDFEGVWEASVGAGAEFQIELDRMNAPLTGSKAAL